MKILYVLFALVNCEKIIKNTNIPSCRNCVHYKPRLYDSDFTSSSSKCEKFGEKNIITDKIDYGYADLTRRDESLCGKQGKYFEREQNVDLKIFVHSIVSNVYVWTTSIVLLFYIVSYSTSKH